jgi:hypothetical protein
MTSFTAYLIFWLPPGVHFSSSVSDANYEQLVSRYFEDVGGSPFYNIVCAGRNGTPAAPWRSAVPLSTPTRIRAPGHMLTHSSTRTSGWRSPM